MVVKILIDNAVHKLNKVYDYKIKAEHEEAVELGKRVRVNFGSGKGSSREGIIVKILKDEENIREVVPFPLSANGSDMMMGCPSEVFDYQLKDVHIKVDEK